MHKPWDIRAAVKMLRERNDDLMSHGFSLPTLWMALEGDQWLKDRQPEQLNEQELSSMEEECLEWVTTVTNGWLVNQLAMIRVAQREGSNSLMDGYAEYLIWERIGPSFQNAMRMGDTTVLVDWLADYAVRR